MLYVTPIDSDEELMRRLSVAAATARKIPEIFKNV